MLAKQMDVAENQPASPLPRVLLVDDEPAVLRGLTRNLAGLFEVHTATSAYAALELIEDAGPFAVIMADMRMPGLDGVGFLETAMARAPASVRLMLTGDLRPQSMAAAINRGRVFRFLEKPCDRRLLIETMQAAVVEYERTLERERAAADIFSGVNHELRTPLNHIIGFASLLESEDQPSNAIVEYAKAIRKSGQALLEITDTLITLACVRDGGLEMQKHCIPLAMFLDDLQDANERSAENRQIGFQVYADTDVPSVLVMNEPLMEFALNMLIAQTLHAGGPGGELDVRVEAQDETILFLISYGQSSDTGSVTALRACAPSIEGVKGAGFGLSLLRAVAELHEGDISTRIEADGRITTIVSVPRGDASNAILWN